MADSDTPTAAKARRVDIADIGSLVGKELGPSSWVQVTQEDVNRFAEATGDRQWIHVNPARAAKALPGGTTIAHGYFTLSLGPRLLSELLVVEGVAMALNYGLNRVRFPAPVPVGSRVRLHAVLQQADDLGDAVQAVIALTFALDGSEKPACVADAVFRYYRG